MYFIKNNIFNLLKRVITLMVITGLFLSPIPACANIVDALNLAPVIPTILDAFMTVATGSYEFFVGNGTGIIYIFIWGFLIISLSLYLLKMYFPKNWLSFFGFSGGGEIAEGKADAMTISANVLKPIIRALIAAVVLLQIRPVYLTEFLVNPFLQFGSLYTESIISSINEVGIKAEKIECPPSITEKGWLTESSCEFMVQPVADLSHANNQIIKRGFDFLKRGLRGLMTLIPHGGENFLNIITGIFLIVTFVSSNLFMALLIIQAIFNFGMSLILYPFQVLVYVAKPNEKWFDIWPAFSGVTKALQQMIITMIACAIILFVNISIIKSLFQWNSSVFVIAANGSASSNVPQTVSNVSGFGEHSILWLSSILTFYLMFNIFNMAREQLNKYTGKGMDSLYKQTIEDTKTIWESAKTQHKKIKEIKELIGKEKN